MAQIINNYEMMLIAHQSVTDEVINASITNLVDVINANEGQLLTQDDWGRVRTAYQSTSKAFKVHLARVRCSCNCSS